MTLFDTIRKRYTIKTKCLNCGYIQDTSIPKGKTIDSWIKSQGCVCDNCGCSTLTQIGEN